MLDTYEHDGKRKFIGIIIAIVVVAGVVVLADHLRSGQAASTSTTATETTVTTDTTDAGPNTNTPNTLKDGSYSATNEYYVPPGAESMTVQVRLQDGIISDVSIENSGNDHDSVQFQNDFTAAYKSHVVGKKITGLHINTLVGASETTQAFNDALKQITLRAQA